MVLPVVFELSDLDGNNGFIINGINREDRSGRSVSSTGDVNGDGIADLIIGAPYGDASASGNYYDSGESYVIFGSSNAFSSTLELSSLDGSNGFTINGIKNGDRSGYSVSSGGDVNGDGIADLIIGAPYADANGYSSGESYVIFGSSNGFSSTLELSALDGSNGFTINGVDRRDRSGRSVSSAGDVNGDGIDDLIIGAPYGDGITSGNYDYFGESYVVFGSSNGFSSTLELSALDGSNGFTINGVERNDLSGRSVSSVGDVNGDGIADLIIGAPFANANGYSSGESYVVFGSSNGFASTLELSALDGSNGFILNAINSDDQSGISISNAGDVNDDSIDDLIIGASGAAPNGYASGESYVVFGSSNGFSSTLELSTLDGSNGFTLNGINNGDNSGSSVSSAGDVNDDGIDDLIIGASGAAPNGNDSGESYVVFGSSNGFSSTLELSTLDGSNGFTINGIKNGDRSGYSVSSSGGDVNGDGIADLIIGASGADPNGYSSGQSYVIFGQPGSLLGNNLDDTLIGTSFSDIISGLDGNDSLTGLLGDDTLDGGNDNDTLLGNTDADSLLGQLGDDSLVGGTEDDFLDGGIGVDTLDGGADNDTLDGGNDNDSLLGAVGDDSLFGNNGDDTLDGASGRDTLNPGFGIDQVDGGTDVDLLVVDFSTGGSTTSVISSITSNGSGSFDGSFSTNNQTANFTNIERFSIIGTTLDDSFATANRNDLLDGELGDDSLNGNQGNDTLIGNRGQDTLIGGDGNDLLDGATSDSLDDSLVGDLGDDTYVINTLTDVVVELSNEGSDTIQTPFSFTLNSVSNIENLTLLGTNNLDGSGTDFNNRIVGNAANNLLRGLAGDDLLSGGEGNDTLFGREDNDTLQGGIGDDLLRDFSGDDLLFGGDGNDTLNGNSGNDILNGEDGNDVLRGGIDGQDLLIGGDDNDILIGLADDDLLLGGSGRDIISSGGGDNLGVDTADGGTGLDLLVVNYGLSTSATGITSSLSDKVRGAYSGSYSTANETFNFINIERFSIIGTAQDDSILTGDGSDIINPKAGDDTVDGAFGSDLLVVDYSLSTSSTGLTSSLINNGAGAYSGSYTTGNETVNFSNIERFNIVGTDQDDLIIGGDVSDILVGGTGNDILIGGNGQDQFGFNAPNEGVDLITDYSANQDLFSISQSGFGLKLPLGTLPANNFVVGASANNSNQLFIYNDATGDLFFDSDGNGSNPAVQLATLGAGLAITNQNFVIAS